MTPGKVSAFAGVPNALGAQEYWTILKSIRIDLSRYYARFDRPPDDHEVGIWTFIIEGEPVALYGSYAEAASKARLYVRLSGLEACGIELVDHAPSGRVRVGLN